MSVVFRIVLALLIWCLVVIPDARAQDRLRELRDMSPEARAELMGGLQPRFGSRNCPASAEALANYLRTGEIRPARGGSGGGGFIDCPDDMREASLGSILSFVRGGGHGTQVVIGATGPGDRQHYAVLVNIDGVVYYVDAYTRPPAFTTEVEAYLSWANRFEYTTDFRLRWVPEGETPSCPGATSGDSAPTTMNCSDPNGCLPGGERTAARAPAAAMCADCPEPLPSATGRSHGDPHIVTLDGYQYSFQTVGEYILVRSRGGFEMQTRQQRLAGRDVTLNTAVAFRDGDRRIVIYARAFPGVSVDQSHVYVDGVPFALTAEPQTIQRATISETSPGHYELVFPMGLRAEVTRSEFGEFAFLNAAFMSPPTLPGYFEGLLGDRDGIPGNDLRIRDGAVIAAERSTYQDLARRIGGRLNTPVPLDAVTTQFYDALYRRFGDSWRVAPEESLFDYGPGESTASYTSHGFPSSYLNIARLLPRQLQAAERTCRQAGVPEDMFQGCVFDVAATGESGFAAAAVNLLRDRVEDEARRRLREQLQPRWPF